MILITILVIAGLITALIAKKNGRSKSLAFILGFCFGIIAIIGYLIAGESEALKRERIRAAMRD